MKRHLTEEEKRLWHYVTRHDKALHPNMAVHLEAPPVTLKKPRVKADYAPLPRPIFQAERALALSQGSYANIDRNTAERFRRGQYPLDGTLDLHGMNREKAWRALQAFMHGHAERGSRCLLIITGKGLRQQQEGGQGVLRELLPRWLDEPHIRPLILAFDTAAPKLGGSGATMVLLKRRR